MSNLIGTAPNQVPTNGMLGTLAFQDYNPVPSSADIISGLGFTPYNVTNPTGYITSASLTTYLTAEVAGTTYQTISGMSSYLPTSTAATTYAPISTTVTLVGTQTLTNKTLTMPTITGVTETTYSLDGNDINPTNGTIQYKTLSGAITFTESLADGQCVTLMLNPSTFVVTWPAITWIGAVASTAPTLIASVFNCITLFQLNGVLYGKFEGRV